MLLENWGLHAATVDLGFTHVLNVIVTAAALSDSFDTRLSDRRSLRLCGCIALLLLPDLLRELRILIARNPQRCLVHGRRRRSRQNESQRRLPHGRALEFVRQRYIDDLRREHLVLFSFTALIAPVRTWDIEATPLIHLVLELAGLDARELGDAERGRKGIRGARRRRRLPLGYRHRVARGPVTT